MAGIPRVFIGSSSQSLELARDLKKQLGRVAVADVWENAFKPGGVLLAEILKLVDRYDFGVFVFNPDDLLRLRRRGRLVPAAHTTVRDNVLFEAGVFMGALGPERTFIVMPEDARGKMRIPSDLEGLLTVNVPRRRMNGRASSQAGAISSLLRAVEDLGPALRNSYNEVLELARALDRLEFKKHRRTYVLGDLIRHAAATRKRAWTEGTSPFDLMEPIFRRNGPDVADDAYWWLVVRGVLCFRGIENFTSSRSWHWRESIEYAALSERGVVLLNHLKAAYTRPVRGGRVASVRTGANPPA